jgi:hypothetical protein
MSDEYYGSAEQEFWEGRPDGGQYPWFLTGVDSHTNRRAEIPGSGCMSKQGAEILRTQLQEATPRRWRGITVEYRYPAQARLQ